MRSPTLAFRQSLHRVCRSCNTGAYPLINLLQNSFPFLYFFREHRACLTKVPVESASTGLCSSRWLGVSGSGLLESSEIAQTGLGFKIDSSSVSDAAMASSSTRPLPRIAVKRYEYCGWAFPRSTPIAWEALGGWKIHWHPLCCNWFRMWSWFRFRLPLSFLFLFQAKFVRLSPRCAHFSVSWIRFLLDDDAIRSHWTG